jgi:hypothetical protein
MSELAISAEFTIHEIETDFLRQFDPFRTQVRASSHTWLRERRLMSPSLVREHAEDLRYTDLLTAEALHTPSRGPRCTRACATCGTGCRRPTGFHRESGRYHIAARDEPSMPLYLSDLAVRNDD